MVSYFVPRGRFLIKTANLRPSQKQQGKWPLFRSLRQTFSTKSSGTQFSTVNKADTEVSSIIKNTNLGKSVQRKFDKENNHEKQRHKSVWVRWTGFLLRLAPVGICVFGAIEWQLHKRKCQKEQIPRTASEFQSKVYCSLPLRFLSRCWGWLAACYVPSSLRTFLYGCYSNLFDVNMDEALYSDYEHYSSLSEFFTRPLKDGARVIDAKSQLISPADGKVLHFGSASKSLIEQVKGVNYSMESFIGPPTWINKQTEANQEAFEYAEHIKEKKDGSTELYQCVIYLAPGDYHRFHSPANWQPSIRRHFSGELLSVSPKVATWLPGLFCLNERVLYIGRWKHGFLSYTAVGATNVGSVQIYMDEQLKTNRWMGFNVGSVKKTAEYEEILLGKDIELIKGDLLGQFNMGSTIVLIFEAPKNFKFNIQAGQKIYVGESLGCFE